MNQVDIVHKLKQYVSNNPAVRQLLTVWAGRTRSRTTVTVGAVTQMMHEAGYTHPRGKYSEILKVFGETFGFGTLIHSSRGNVVAMTNTRYTLMSIAQCGLGLSSELKGRKMGRTIGYAAVPNVTREAKGKIVLKKTTKAEKKVIEAVWDNTNGITLAFPVRGKMFTVVAPKDCTGEDLLELVHKFQNLNKTEDKSQ